MADNQDKDIMQLVECFRMKASEKSESTVRSYHKAIASFASFVGTYFDAATFPSETFLTEWFLHMRVHGLTEKTALHYFDVIAALYRDTEDKESDTCGAVFRTVKNRIRHREQTPDISELNETILQRVRKITKAAPHQQGGTSLATDIILFSLMNRGMSMLEVVKQKTADIEPGDIDLEALMKRRSSPRRKYLFDMGQSRLTDRQLNERVSVMLTDFMRRHEIPLIQTVDNTMKALWAYAALADGISGSEVLGILGSAPCGIPALGFCVPAEIEATRKDILTRTVTSTFVDNPLHWYAMRLRPRVKYTDVLARIAHLDDIFRPELFYPYDEITRRIGKKLVHDRQPVIKDIVFFRLRSTDIPHLFRLIGDIAWCYTTTGRPGGDYAAIPCSSFAQFQTTIGHFTPDYEISAIGGFEPVEGEEVVVLNGLFTDQAFNIEKIEQRENTVFQLRMIGSNGIQWRIKALKQHFKPLHHPAHAAEK